MKKVAILGSFPPLRAISSYCLSFSVAMAAEMDVEFISFNKIYPAFLYPGGKLEEDDTFPRIDATGLSVRRRLAWYDPTGWVREGLAVEAELLHAQWWSLPLAPVYAAVTAGFRLRRKPVVITVHNVSSHEKSRLYGRVSKLIFNLGDHFIVHSEANRRQLIDCYDIPMRRTHVIPHGILDFFVPKNHSREEARNMLGIGSDSKVVLLFGAIRDYKGVDTALSAFAEVVREVPDAVLLIAGKLWEKWEPYEQLIRKLDIGSRVIVVPEYIPSADVWRYFVASDMVVLPYKRFAGQSGVGSVAPAFNKPMVVSRVGGLADLVSDKKFIVPPENDSALARAIITRLNESTSAHRGFSSNHSTGTDLSWTDIAQKTREVYRQALSENDRSRHAPSQHP